MLNEKMITFVVSLSNPRSHFDKLSANVFREWFKLVIVILMTARVKITDLIHYSFF